MGFRERFRREDDGDGASDDDEAVTVGDLTIAIADPATPEPVYSPTPESSSAAAALNDLLRDGAPTGRSPEPAPPVATAPASPAPPPADDAAQIAATGQPQSTPADREDPSREALVRPRLATWQTAALGSPKKVDEDKLFEEAALGRFERKAAPHLAAPAVITPAAPPHAQQPAGPAPAAEQPAPLAPVAPATSTPSPAPAAEATSTEAEFVDDLDLEDASSPEDAEDSDRALARRASKLLERGDLSPDDPEVVHLLEVVNSSGERARPGELVDLTRLPASERTRLIIRVLCGLVAELPTEDAPLEATDAENASEAATA